MPSPRRFPAPWSIVESNACFIVKDSDGQPLAYVYFENEPGRRSSAKLLTRDEAFLIAKDTLAEAARAHAEVLPGRPEPGTLDHPIIQSSSPGPSTAGPLFSAWNQSSSQDRDKTDADHAFHLPAGVAGLRVAFL
jgi:hypothetical protein